MDLKKFETLYRTTYALKPMLDKFWSVAVYDLEGESLGGWRLTRQYIEKNCQEQRKMLKEYFQSVFPTSREDINLSELACLLKEFPSLVEGNKEKLAILLQGAPRNEDTETLFSIISSDVA